MLPTVTGTIKKSLDFRQIDKLIVLSQSAATPTDPDWDAFLDALGRHRHELDRVRVALFSAGGGPTLAQRARLAAVLRGQPVPIAVVTGSATVRFIVSSLALLNRQIATFQPDDLEGAFSHLQLTPLQRRSVGLALAEMKSTVA